MPAGTVKTRRLGAENETTGRRKTTSRSTPRVAQPDDITAHRRRRDVRNACRRTERHLRDAGLWGVLSARVLDDIEAAS
ncbi:hypothetical protein GCM10009676_31190 [Prauserella halophila]|uniref:Uncharacterized protein n=1 Tax=Prauserella halophila TaxID=185641 RepID=A0ABP4GZ00_9PSEU|nr:hypothetical protein [Prauserella halophila]